MDGMGKNVLAIISPMSAQRMEGIAQYARGRGWHLMIQDRLGYRPLAWKGDGIIATLRSDPSTFETVKSLVKRGVPAVDLTWSRPEFKIPRVTSDHFAIGRLAAEHFAERNFKHVAWFSTGWGHVHALRFAGLRSVFPAMRWVLTDELPKTRLHSYGAFSKWLARTLSKAPKPLAALAYDEADAARLLDAALRCGASVPEELAILSIGNNPFICESQAIPLSSIDQNLERGGYEAAALLDRLMDGGKPPSDPVMVPPKGVAMRRSTDIVAAADPLVRSALDYISANISRPFGAAQIADALGCGRSALDKRFAAETGHSIGAEISRRRLALAKVLLSGTGKTIAEIAAETGFCTASYLSNIFRDATGKTPRQWRNGENNPAAPGEKKK